MYKYREGDSRDRKKTVFAADKIRDRVDVPGFKQFTDVNWQGSPQPLRQESIWGTDWHCNQV